MDLFFQCPKSGSFQVLSLSSNLSPEWAAVTIAGCEERGFTLVPPEQVDAVKERYARLTAEMDGSKEPTAEEIQRDHESRVVALREEIQQGVDAQIGKRDRLLSFGRGEAEANVLTDLPEDFPAKDYGFRATALVEQILQDSLSLR